MNYFTLSLSNLSKLTLLIVTYASGSLYGAATGASREYTFINDTDKTFHIRLRDESSRAGTKVAKPSDQKNSVNAEVFKFAPKTAFKITSNSPGTLRLTGWPHTVIPSLDIDANGKPVETSNQNKNASHFSVVPPYQTYQTPIYVISSDRNLNLAIDSNGNKPTSTQLPPSSYYLHTILFKKPTPNYDSNLDNPHDPWNYFNVELKEYANASPSRL